MKYLTLREAMEHMLAGSWKTDIPVHVRRNLLGDMRCSISYAGEQVSIGEADYAALHEIREAIEWVVKQFNGDVTWK